MAAAGAKGARVTSGRSPLPLLGLTNTPSPPKSSAAGAIDLTPPLRLPGVGGFSCSDFVTPAPPLAPQSLREPTGAQAPPFRFLESLSFAYHIFIHKKQDGARGGLGAGCAGVCVSPDL